MTDCAGRAPRSTWIQPSPSPRVSVRAHRRTSFAPKAELGTSRTMLHTSLSAKKSSPVNCKLFFAPSTSQKKGSRRQPAKKRVSPASVTFASRPNETGARSTIILPPSPVPAACGPSTRRTLAVCAPRSKAENRTRYAISATELPNSALGAKEVRLWARTLTPDDGGGWRQVERGARPAQAVILVEERDAYLGGEPATDGRFLASFAHALEHTGGYTSAEAKRVAATLLPDILPYDSSRPASFPDNGRALTDDAFDFFMRVLTNGKVNGDNVGLHRDLLLEFTFFVP